MPESDSQFRRAPEWLHRMEWTLIHPYAITIVFGQRPHPKHAVDINVASACVVDNGGRPFLVTAGHVLAKALKRRREPNFHLVIGEEVEVRLDPDAAHIDEVRDVGTLRLAQSQRDALIAEGFFVVTPSGWPLPVPIPNDAVVMCGYPGTWRRHVAWNELEVAAFSMLGLVHAIHDHKFVCHLDPAYVVESVSDPSVELPPMSMAALPGLSGGPAFMVSSEPMALIAPRFCAVVTQGWFLEGNLILNYARLDHLDTQGGRTEP